MKKKLMTLLVAISAMALVLTACGGKKTEDNSKSRADSSESEGAVSENGLEGKSKSDDFIVYQGSVSSEESCDVNYTCYVRDDNTADIYEEYCYSDLYKLTYFYTGDYEETKDGIKIFYVEDESSITFDVVIEDNVITNVIEEYGDASTPDYPVGEYGCVTDELGDVLLSVNEDGTVSCTNDVATYDGNMIYINDRWDVMLYETANSDTYFIDWYVDFKGSKFTYESYNHATYGHLEGEYVCDGELGKITVTVDSEGVATSTIKIDGKKKEFIGSVTEYKDEEDNVTNIAFYLSSDDDYDITIELDSEVEKGVYAYTGSLTKKFSFM